MKRLAVLIPLAAFLLMGAATQPYPLGFWIYGSSVSGDKTRGDLLVALECAVERWRAATCLDINVDMTGPGFVRWRHADELAPNVAQTLTPYSASRIQISDGKPLDFTCPVLIHEMGHVLRRSPSHPGPDGSMSFPMTRVTSSPVSRITADDLNAVCAVQPCGCFVPE